MTATTSALLDKATRADAITGSALLQKDPTAPSIMAVASLPFPAQSEAPRTELAEQAAMSLLSSLGLCLPRCFVGLAQ